MTTPPTIFIITVEDGTGGATGNGRVSAQAPRLDEGLAVFAITAPQLHALRARE